MNWTILFLFLACLDRRDAHLAYIDAGADIITTNNYAVVPACIELCDDFVGGDEALCNLIRDAGKCARAVCLLFGHNLLMIYQPKCTIIKIYTTFNHCSDSLQ